MKSQIAIGKQNCPQTMTELALRISLEQSIPSPISQSPLLSSPLIFILALLYAFSFMPLFLFAWPNRKVQFPFKLVNVGFSGMKRGDGFLGIQSQNHHLRHMKRRLPFPCRELAIEVIIITPIIQSIPLWSGGVFLPGLRKLISPRHLLEYLNLHLQKYLNLHLQKYLIR